MTDFSKPQRMGVCAFAIIFIKTLKSIIGAVAIYSVAKILGSDFSLTDGTVWLRILVVIGIIIAISFCLAVVVYYPKKFYIKNQNLIFTHGLISRETMTIPLDRVHSLRTKRGIWYRLFGMRGIVFDTIASKGEEIELILDESDWNSLMHLIECEENYISAVDNVPPPFNPTLTKRFDNIELLKDALCQNHLKGLAILGGFFAIVFDRISDITDNTAETVANYTFSLWNNFVVSPLDVVVLMVIMYILVLMLWVANVMMRYYDMYVVFDKKQLSFNYGLLTRLSSRFPFGKICTIWVKRNFIEQKLGLCTILLKQALYASAQKEEDKLKLYGADSSAFFLDWWLGKDYQASVEIISAKSGRGVVLHTIMPWLVISLVATIVSCHLGRYLFTIIPITCLLISLFSGILAMRRSKIILRESYFVINNGRMADVANYIKYNNIEVVGIRSTPFSKWFHRVTLVLSTSGTTFKVRSLKENEAQLIYALLLIKSDEM